MELKNGPMLAIDHMVFYQMCGDPEFFTAVPAFFFLKGPAEAAVARVVQVVVDGRRDCAGCGDLRSIVGPVMAAFVDQVRRLHASGPAGAAALKPLADYVSRRRGLRPTPIRVYYRAEDGSVGSIDL